MAALGRLLRTWKGDGRSGVMFWCPGCVCAHVITTQRDDGQAHPCWTYDGDIEAPTFAPSVLIFIPASTDPEWVQPQQTLCHLFVRAGHIQFLTDCAHALAGQTVPMQPIPDDYGGGLD